MQSAEIRIGRRFVVVLEPGEDLLDTLGSWCRKHDVRRAVIPSFFGAFRAMSVIATTAAVKDDEAPLGDQVTVAYVEGVGSGSISPRGADTVVHLHAAVGTKSRAGEAVAGHVLAAEVHYTVEVLVDEVLDPAWELTPRAESAGLDCVTFP